MLSSFQNPRNPLAAAWASAAETFLRKQHPNASIQQIRQLPFMQGVYHHLSLLKQKKRLDKPPGDLTLESPVQDATVEQLAYLSQTYFDLALTTAAFCAVEQEWPGKYEWLYLDFLNKLEEHNEKKGIMDFSTSDLWGFSLCVIIWIALVGLTGVDKISKKLVDYILDKTGLTQDQKKYGA